MFPDHREDLAAEPHPRRQPTGGYAPEAEKALATTDGGAHSAPYLPGPTGIAMLQRSAGNQAVAALLASREPTHKPRYPSHPTVQRDVNKKGTFKGSGNTDDGSVFVNANANVEVTEGPTKVSHPTWFQTEAVETIEVEAGATGNIMLKMPWYWHHHSIIKEPGKIYGTNDKHINVGGEDNYWASSAFNVGEDGKVVFTGQAAGGTLGAMGYLDGVAVLTPAGGDGSGSVTLTITFKAQQTTNITDTGTRSTTGTATGGVTGTAAPLGVGGSATVGGSYGVTEANSHAAGMTLGGTTVVTCSFGINIKVKPLKIIEKTAEIAYNRDGNFKSGNEGIAGVRSWWNTVPKAVQDLIIAGKLTVGISGNATKTGDNKKNEAIILKRLGDVEERLKGIAPGLIVQKDGRNFTDLDRRFVGITVKYTAAQAKGAGTPLVKP